MKTIRFLPSSLHAETTAKAALPLPKRPSSRTSECAVAAKGARGRLQKVPPESRPTEGKLGRATGLQAEATRGGSQGHAGAWGSVRLGRIRAGNGGEGVGVEAAGKAL